MANVIIDIASEFTGKKAFKQADTATQKLGKSVKTLGRNLGFAFGGTALLAGSKRVVKAFAEDDKAAKILSRSLDNLGLAYADSRIKDFISSLETQYGVLDDKLRPAYQKLLTTTGDWRKSQTLLKTALDLSAMSGADVVSVASDLSKAFAGNTRGLIKYGIGLDKAQIAAMSFDEILTQIATVSSGQAQVAADSLAGSLDKLKVASANASESLGKDLVTALSTLGGAGGLPKTLSLIESVASGIGDAVIGTSRLIQTFSILGSGNPFESFKDLAKARRGWARSDLNEQMMTSGRSGMTVMDPSAVKADAKARALAKTSYTIAKKTVKVNSESLKLAKAKANFDLQKIQIEAALKGKISDEEKARLLLLKAIENENAGDIDKYTKALDAARAKTKELQDALNAVKDKGATSPFVNWPSSLTTTQDALTKFISAAMIKFPSPFDEWFKGMSAAEIALERFKESGGFRIAGVGAGSTVVGSNSGATGQPYTIGGANSVIAGVNTGTTTVVTPTVNVTVQGTVTSETDLVTTIVEAINQTSWAGVQTAWNRAAREATV